MTDWRKDVMMTEQDALERGLRVLSGEPKGIDPNIVQPPGRQLLPTRVMTSLEKARDNPQETDYELWMEDTLYIDL